MTFLRTVFRNNIFFDPSKTTCIHCPCHHCSFPGKELSFMSTTLKYVSEFMFLGISIVDNDITWNNISKASGKFAHKSNQVINNF